MAVPLLDLKIQNLALETELKAAFERVLRSGQYILGPELQRFEKQLAALTGTRHAIAVASGTDAILVSLMALGIGPGDEVLCPSFTFFATAGCISRLGAKPVFMDSCPTCFNLDVRDAARKLTPRTKAIIPVHLFGQCADMAGVLALARERGLRVVEDAAQALGAGWQDHRAGSLGDLGTFSFFPSKNLGGFGDGGLVVTQSDALAEQVRLLRTHGSKPKYYHKVVGGNFRLDPLQTALLAVKLPRYTEYTRQRQANAAYYTEHLSLLANVVVPAAADCVCADPAGAQKHGLVLPSPHPGREHIWNQYTLRVLGGKRDALRDHLTARDIGNEIYYPVPMHRQECFAPVVPLNPALPVAERLSGECLSLPIYPELTREQKDEVLQAVADFFKA